VIGDPSAKEGKVFFFEKKKQKTFGNAVAIRRLTAWWPWRS
jgi:hypothetical protein